MIRPVSFVVDPRELPLRLVLFRIIEAAEGPVHQVEISKTLELLGIEHDHKALGNRLSELTRSEDAEMMIRRVRPGIYVKIGE